MDTATAAAIFAGAGLLWTAIWSIISANKLNQIQQQVTQSNRLHDQSVQRLNRAREAVITRNKALIYLTTPEGSKEPRVLDYDKNIPRFADYSAAHAELKGIAIAIDDPKLIELTDQLGATEKEIRTWLAVQNNSKELHTRITELLQEATKL